mgnify:CR=1 FL=1
MVGTLDGPRRYRAEIVRVVSGDSGPEGPGLKTVHLPTSIDGDHAGAPQPIDAGSYVIVDHPEAFGGLARFTVQAFIQPTRVPIRPAPARQVIMGTWAEDRRAGFALMLDETGALAFLHGGTVVSTRVPLAARRWYHVGAAVDLVANTVTLRQTPLADHSPSLEPPAAVTAPLAAQAGATRRALHRRRPRGGRGRPAANHVALQRQDRRAEPGPPRAHAGRAAGRRDGAEHAVPTAGRARSLGFRRRHRQRLCDRPLAQPPARPHRECAQARGHRPQLGRHRDGLAPGARAVGCDPLPRRRSLRRRLAAEPHHDHPDQRPQRRLRAEAAGRGRPRLLGRVLRASAAARATRAGGVPGLHRHLPRLLELSRAHAPGPGRAVHRRAAHRGSDRSAADVSPRAGRLHLRLALRRLRRVPRLAPAADRQHPAHRLAVEPVPRFLSARLAGSPGAVVRRHHRRRSARRRPAAARGLSGRPHRLPSPSTTRGRCWTRCRPTSGAVGGSCTWAATASTGGCRIPPPTPG